MTEGNEGASNDNLLDDDYNDEELDKLLNDGEKKEEEKKEEKKEEEEKPSFYKKVGSREFKSETDYDKFVTTLYGHNSNLAGKIKELGGDPNEVIKPKKQEVQPQKEQTTPDKEEDIEKVYYKVEALRFTKQFPEAQEYKEEMQVLIKNGRANINDEPSYAMALLKVLRAEGKEIPAKLISRVKSELGKDEDEPSVIKKVIKSGGTSGFSQEAEQHTYSQEDKAKTSSFADKLVSGRIKSF